MLQLKPITMKAANVFIRALHRHHPHVRGCVFCLSAVNASGQVAGVVVAGRPVARGNDDGMTLEVTRLCSDGTPNVCSFLYSAAKRAAKSLGYLRCVTYILASEPGTSLVAAGWHFDGVVKGRSWSRDSRPREDVSPTSDKVRYSLQLQQVL